MIDMTPELRFEKVVQHSISYAHYLGAKDCRGNADASDILMASAARAYRAKCMVNGEKKPDEWVGQAFAQYMRELVLDGQGDPPELPPVDQPPPWEGPDLFGAQPEPGVCRWPDCACDRKVCGPNQGATR